MRPQLNYVVAPLLWLAATASAFEGRITAVTTQGGQTQTFLYTIGTNDVRIECTETNRPYARNLVNRESGALTLLFPHNRSFVRLKPPGANAASPFPGPPGMPPPPPRPPMPNLPAPPAGLPPGVGPQPGAMPGAAGMPAAPMMPMMPMEEIKLNATGEKTNLLGYVCTRYELKQRGEVMEVWATDKLLPFHAWLQNQPPRFGPRRIEEQWGDLLQAKKLFPLLAVLKFENGPERYRFEVKSVMPEKIKKEDEGKLFQPPPDYQEIQPLPF